MTIKEAEEALGELLDLARGLNMATFLEAMHNCQEILALLKEQETMMQCIKGKCRICPHCTNCDVDENGLLKEQDKPKGHWMPYEPDKRGYTDGFTCSRCERVILSDHYCKMIDFDFCPYCGAYMDNAEGR